VLIEGSSVEPVIMTGLDAMGRTSENEKLLYAFNDLSALNNVPEQFTARFKISDLLTTILIGRDVDAEVVYTEKEFAATQAQNAEQQVAAGATESMIDKAEPEQLAEGLKQGA